MTGHWWSTFIPFVICLSLSMYNLQDFTTYKYMYADQETQKSWSGSDVN